MSPRRTSLLQGYIEKVSWQVLDEYPKLVQELIRNKSGVYALYGRHIYSRIYYFSAGGRRDV